MVDPTRPQQGFTLLEVLIAVIVLSIGLLGLASLQANSLRSNHNAYLRSQATMLAYDIIDRMRANLGNRVTPAAGTALAGAYDIELGATPAGAGIVFNDLTAWKNALATTLPGPGDGSIAIAPGNIVTVVVQWDDRDDTRGVDVPMEFQIQSQL